jgi:hypothetical protein
MSRAWSSQALKPFGGAYGDPTLDSERLHRVSPLFNADKIRKPRTLKVESDEIVAALPEGTSDGKRRHSRELKGE